MLRDRQILKLGKLENAKNAERLTGPSAYYQNCCHPAQFDSFLSASSPHHCCQKYNRVLKKIVSI